MPSVTYDQLVAYTAAAISFTMAVFERRKSSQQQVKTEAEQQLLADAKAFEARSTMLTKLAEDNLKLYEQEHAQHEKTREYWHEQSNKFQTAITHCQDKLQEQKLRPDYSEIFRMIQEQTKMNGEILVGIQAILTEFKRQSAGR